MGTPQNLDGRWRAVDDGLGYALFVATSPVTNLYLLGWSMLLWLGWTMINIPYYAWGAELSTDFDERTQITGWRQAWGFAGNISVLLVPVAAAKLFGYGGVAREALVIIAGMVLILLPLLIGLTVWKLPERDRRVARASVRSFAPHAKCCRTVRS